MSRDLLQYAHACLGLVSQELDMILQMCLTSDEQRGRNISLNLLVVLLLILSRQLLTCQLVIHQDPQVLLCQAALEPAEPHPALVHSVNPFTCRTSIPVLTS